MTAGQRSSRPANPVDETAREWAEHSSARRVNTDVVMVESLRAQYPHLHLTVVPQFSCNLLSFASAGHASLAPIDKEKDHSAWRLYIPPATRLNGSKGGLADSLKFGKYLITWKSKEFVIYVVDARDGTSAYPTETFQYILSPSVEATNELLLDAGKWGNDLHDEIWVYDGGYWQKSAELYDGMRKARWDDVILDAGIKDAIINDVDNFFSSRETYDRLRVQWKRGIIFYGPPGNGKTISIKAMMHSFYQRDPVVPTLYVRSLASFGGPEYSLAQIFGKARASAPCFLIFEDLDSVIGDNVRSYFLNEVDGIRRNDGILMVGSTNHLDRLDPGISKRPSRFDRRYLFPDPTEPQRVSYLQYWQHKLSDNADLEFPDKLCPAVARITHGFSFAYIQEAIVASLLVIARGGDGDGDGNGDGDDEHPGSDEHLRGKVGDADAERRDDVGPPRVCLECLQAHARPVAGGSCDRDSVRSFRGLYEFASAVRRLDDEDPDLDRYVLWREIKKQVRLLREELGDDEKGRAARR